jgi:hypothetical protein
MTELALADLAAVERTLNRESKKARSGDKEAQQLVGVLERLLPHLNEGRPGAHAGAFRGRKNRAQAALPADHQADDVRRQRPRRRFREQPLPRPPARSMPPPKARRWSPCAPRSKPNSPISTTKTRPFLADLGLEEPGLNRLIRAAYQLLGLQTYFTAGVKEVRAWTIHVGDTAPQAAGVIHTDFERGFIRAQTIALADFIAYKGEQGAKEAGKMRAEGKEYVVKDGDVLNFLFNVYPAEIRRQFHLSPSDRLEWVVDSQGIRVVPVRANPIAAFRGQGKGGSTQRLLQDRKEELVGE